MSKTCFRLFLFAMLLLPFKGNTQFYSGSLMDFGKNRIQYHPFDWSYFRYERFDVFFYAGGKETALHLARAAKNYIPAIEQRFDYGLDTRLQILVFNRLSDLKQTNLGTGRESILSLGGTVRQAGNKIFLFMEDGDANLYKQLREGIATVLVSELLLGTDFRDKVKNSAFMHVPEWYFKGLVSWMAEGWNTQSEGVLRDGFQTGKFLYPGRLEGEEAIIAGKSIWNYIAAVYGEKVIPDMLDMAHLNRNIEGGFRFVLGLQLKEVLAEWQQYYSKHFAEPDSVFGPLPKAKYSRKAQRNSVITCTKISPDGQQMAWIENRQGRVSICTVPLSGEKMKRIIFSGRRLSDITDYSTPLFAWHPNHELLVYTDEFKGRLRLNFYNLQTGETDHKFLEFFTKVSGIDISPDGKRILMTAVKNGNPDIYIFNNVSNTIEQITDDGFDEANARWFPDGISMIFSSNRNTDSLKTGKNPDPSLLSNAHDLFLYQPDRLKKTCLRLSNTPAIDERSPIPLDSKHWVFLSDKNGIVNRYLGESDSVITHVDTLVHYRYFMHEIPQSNRSGNILETDMHPSGIVSEVQQVKGRYKISIYENALERYSGTLPVSAWGKFLQASSQAVRKIPKQEEVQHQGKVRKIVVFGKDHQQEPLPGNAGNAAKDSLRSVKQRVYFTSWFLDQFNVRIARNFLNQSYQPYTGQGGYINPPMNGLFRIDLADVFEDYRITAGIRLAANFSGNEYLLVFQNQKKRLDKTYTFHRQAIQDKQLDDARLLIHTLGAGLSWPFSPVARLSGNLSYRNDRKIYLSTDLSTLRKPIETNHWVQPKLEYVFDNTFPLSLNMLTGTRLKVTSEFFFSAGSKKIYVGVIGADIRHYFRITREAIFAIRLAGASSFGTGKLLFSLGGIDSWISPQTESGTSIDQSKQYVFQTLATNMRGFRQNIRNGNNFGVLNMECRWSPIRSISKYPVKNDFLNSLQLVPFFDIGTAFTGPQPWSEKNSFNQTIIQNGPITVTLKNLNNPIVYGTGLGLRARIFGYFVRFDYARGILNGQMQPRLFYLSFCTDF